MQVNDVGAKIGCRRLLAGLVLLELRGDELSPGQNRDSLEPAPALRAGVFGPGIIHAPHQRAGTGAPP